MRWEDERYVRVYTRDTGEWLALGWEAQALFLFLLRKADRAGLVHTGKAGLRGLAALAGMPLEVVQRAAPLLLEDGCLKESTGGYVIPNFMAAQEARASDAQRKRDQRERDRDKAIASGSSGSRAGLDAEATETRASSRPGVTHCGHAVESHAVTRGHAWMVTPSLAVPSRAEPFLPSEGAAVAAPPDDLPDATDDAEEADSPPVKPAANGCPDCTDRVACWKHLARPKPGEKLPRTPSAGETLYANLEAAREKRCLEAGQPYVSEKWAAARQNKEFGPICRLPEPEIQRFEDAFAAYLADERKGQARVPWSISLFMHGAVRAEYETKAMREAGAA